MEDDRDEVEDDREEIEIHVLDVQADIDVLLEEEFVVYSSEAGHQALNDDRQQEPEASLNGEVGTDLVDGASKEKDEEGDPALEAHSLVEEDLEQNSRPQDSHVDQNAIRGWIKMDEIEIEESVVKGVDERRDCKVDSDVELLDNLDHLGADISPFDRGQMEEEREQELDDLSEQNGTQISIGI